MISFDPPQLFIDLDGVLADFDGGYFQAFGYKINRELDGTDPPNFWKNIREHGQFYRTLLPMPDALELWKGAHELHHHPVILTGLPDTIPNVEQHKRAWVAEFISKDAEVICCKSANKRLHGRPGDILIDDWTKYQKLWEMMGGFFILHRSTESSLRQAKEILQNNPLHEFPQGVY